MIEYFPSVVAGLLAVLVGFTSAVVIVFQAATAVGATPEQASSWIAALCLGMGVTGIALSLKYRAPVVTASGVTLFGVGSAFWGLVAGLLALTFTRNEPEQYPERAPASP